MNTVYCSIEMFARNEIVTSMTVQTQFIKKGINQVLHKGAPMFKVVKKY